MNSKNAILAGSLTVLSGCQVTSDIINSIDRAPECGDEVYVDYSKVRHSNDPVGFAVNAKSKAEADCALDQYYRRNCDAIRGASAKRIKQTMDSHICEDVDEGTGKLFKPKSVTILETVNNSELLSEVEGTSGDCSEVIREEIVRLNGFWIDCDENGQVIVKEYNSLPQGWFMQKSM